MPDACRDVLVERNLEQLNYARQSRLFLMSLIDKQFYDSRSDEVRASYDAFSAGWDHFQESYRRETELYKLNFSENEALSVLTMTSLPGAVDAWRQCMLANRRGFFCWLEGDLTGTLFTLWLEWVEPTGLDGKSLTSVAGTVASEAGTSEFLSKLPPSLTPGQFSIGIRRQTNSTRVRGNINARVGTGSYAVSFMVPAYVPPVEIVPSPYYLAQHPEALIQQHNIHAGLQFGRVYWQSTAVIAGVDYTGRALGMHAPDGIGYADFAIPPGARYFSSVVGMARQDSTGDYGAATCRVYIDGQLQWYVGLAGPAVSQTPNINIAPGSKVLRLEVDGGGSNWGDHTTWGDPRFKMRAGE